MAWWGSLLRRGSELQHAVVADGPRGTARGTCRWRATRRTRRWSCSIGVTPPERALIEALPSRYPQDAPAEDMRPWDDVFADAMRKAYAAHPDDQEIACVFVEAMMNRTPWQMWDLAAGEPAEGADTLECRRVLDRAFTEDAAWSHPGLLHLYVHLMEMSPTPEAALKMGDALRTLVPDAGHLIHMPTHIDVLCGHYQNVVQWNQAAIQARSGVLRTGRGARTSTPATGSTITISRSMARCSSARWSRRSRRCGACATRRQRRSCASRPPHGRLLRKLPGFRATCLGPLRTLARMHGTATSGGPGTILHPDGVHLVCSRARPCRAWRDRGGRRRRGRLPGRPRARARNEAGAQQHRGGPARRGRRDADGRDPLPQGRLRRGLRPPAPRCRAGGYDDDMGLQPARHALGAPMAEAEATSQPWGWMQPARGAAGAQVRQRLDLAQARADTPVRAPCGCAQAAMAAE
jgi:hypothetical protein